MTRTKEIQAESQLRDDADYIMSNFVKAIYSTKQETIVNNVTNANGSYLEVSSDITKCPKKEDGSFDIDADACQATLKKIGFVKSGNVVNVQILDKTIKTSHSKILLNPTGTTVSSIIKGKPHETSIYDFTIHLQITYKRLNNDVTKEISFSNSLQPIVQ